MIKVKFIKDFPYKAMGEDLREYGTFKSGDIAFLPKLLASVLIKNGYALSLIGDRVWYPRINMKKEKKEVQPKLTDFLK